MTMHFGIKYPTTMTTGHEMNGDIRLAFGGRDDSSVTVLLTSSQAYRLVRGENIIEPTDPLKEAAMLYATDRIAIEELETRLAVALGEKS